VVWFFSPIHGQITVPFFSRAFKRRQKCSQIRVLQSVRSSFIHKKGKWGLEEIYDKGNGPEAVVRSTGYKGSSPFVQRVIGVKVHGVRNYVLFVDETTSDWRTLICENLRLLLNDLEKNGTVHVLCSKQNSLQNEIQNAFYIQWIHQNDCSRPITKLYRGSVNEQIFYPQDLVTIGSNI